jgi:hypothetical protein
MEIAESLVKAGAFLRDEPNLSPDQLRNRLSESEAISVIAYLQKIGTYNEVTPAKPPHMLDPDEHRRASFRAGKKAEARN